MSDLGNTAKKQGEALGSDDLQALKRGEISMDQYLERRMEIQVQVLGGMITDEQREQLREILKEHFLDDPVLRHYAEQAQGKPSPE